MSLVITQSPDLTLDNRFDVIVNSVSPEFSSAVSDSGINKSCYLLLTGHKGEGPAPAPIVYDTAEFERLNNGKPTYGDVLAVPVDVVALPGSRLKAIVHALAPDMSCRSKRVCVRAACVALSRRVCVYVCVRACGGGGRRGVW